MYDKIIQGVEGDTTSIPEVQPKDYRIHSIKRREPMLIGDIIHQMGILQRKNKQWLNNNLCSLKKRALIALQSGLDYSPIKPRLQVNPIMLTDILHALIVGHNTFTSKACPCFDAVHEYADITSSQALLPSHQ